MMSAAILMTEAVEKVRVRRAYSDLSFDKGEPDGISFAKRFNEPVGDSGLLQKQVCRRGCNCVTELEECGNERECCIGLAIDSHKNSTSAGRQKANEPIRGDWRQSLLSLGSKDQLQPGRLKEEHGGKFFDSPVWVRCRFNRFEHDRQQSGELEHNGIQGTDHLI
jgi:hypothetical protein